MGRWGDGEVGRWGDGEMGRWGDGEICIKGNYRNPSAKELNRIFASCLLPLASCLLPAPYSLFPHLIMIQINSSFLSHGL
ncbi:hypothetical protein BJP34_30745 [Moorena producens PAL-8-15-08-1]|uniref:Uncharacterized protein n=1 Tax=Moorena producens PAL-8-15-08-1 TaxID=1458985 RepID=A0A1D8U019_9CYAN|nr:hypothetical protein [Moorena producens]AOX03237.1 hypothetical protein BJP34_30745 [Moorena producens PAL-8-15-08-1]